jgi:hypothetical protein
MTNGQPESVKNFPFADIAKPNGVVLVEGQGHNVLLLQGQLDPSGLQGRFHLSYLANGLTNKYETCDLLLVKGADAWHAQNAYTGQKVTSVRIVTWSLGLKTLEGICRN